MRAVPPLLLCVLFVGFTWGIPLASAHAAPNKRGYEERLIHDCIDDYFGGDQPNDNRQGHDVMALDVREAWDETLGGNVVVFRLLLNDNAHSGSQLRDEVSFNAKSAAKRYSFVTSDNQAFTGSFEKVVGPTSLNDGQRFAVEGSVRASTLGLKAGDKISSFKVESFYGGSGGTGGTRGDFMPGSYDSNLGPGGSGCPVGSQGGDTIRPDYQLEGPVQYASWNIEPTKITVSPARPQLISLHITNELRQEAQNIRLTAAADEGVEAEFHDIASNEYENPYEFAIDKDVEDHLVHLQLAGTEPGAKGTVGVELRTNLGGRLVEEIEFTVGSGGATSEPADGPLDRGGTDGANGLPAPAFAGALATIAAVIVVGRRRR